MRTDDVAHVAAQKLHADVLLFAQMLDRCWTEDDLQDMQEAALRVLTATNIMLGDR